MKKSNILVIIVIIDLLKRVIIKDIFEGNIKESSDG